MSSPYQYASAATDGSSNASPYSRAAGLRIAAVRGKTVPAGKGRAGYAYGSYNRNAGDSAYGGGGGNNGNGGGNNGKGSGKGLKIAAWVLIVIGIALIIAAAALWLPHYLDYKAVRDTSTAAQEIGVTSQEVVVNGTTVELPKVDFTALKAYNPEIVGWIQIPGTVINYAVPQHTDNDFYLEHALDQSYNPYGSVFMDYRSDPNANDWNTVIYGHHLQNGEEFARIADYSDQTEFDTITQIYYVGSDGTVHILEPLCCFVVDGYDVESVRTDFSDATDFAQYVGSTLERSAAVSSKTVKNQISHLYMLSTCSYDSPNDRTILVCVDASVFGDADSIDPTQSLAAIEQGASGVVAA